MVTAAQFRRHALSLPETQEKSHFGNPDFRVADKIFAGLSNGEQRATLKLTPEIQATLIADASGFTPAAGAWGRSGWTYADLSVVEWAALRALLEESWRLVAPRRLTVERDRIEAPGASSTRTPRARTTPAKKKARARKG